GFTRSLANELGPDGIRVNAICPGAVDGPRIQQVISAKAKMLGKPHAEVEDTYKAQSAMHTMATADDIANQALFVCSALARNPSGRAPRADGHTEKLECPAGPGLTAPCGLAPGKGASVLLLCCSCVDHQAGRP